MNKVSIVIPVYNEKPEGFEIISLRQCFKLLNRYIITLVCNQKLDCEFYKQLAAEYGHSLEVERFDDKYFENISGYSTLLITHLFYSRFIDYDYVLIYQLDCYIFFDNIKDWCHRDIDYIGAPWINVWWLKQTKLELMKKTLHSKTMLKKIFIRTRWFFKGYYQKNALNVGNGGFSLRKVSSCLRITAQTQFVDSWTGNHEDGFWSIYVPLNFDFEIPGYKEALTFSFDCNPKYLFELNKKQLPMGCHAWCRKDNPYEENMIFWQKIIH